MFKEIENTGSVICYQQTGLGSLDAHVSVLHINGTNEKVTANEAAIMRAVLATVARYIELVTFNYINGVVYIHVAMVGDALSELIVARFRHKYPELRFEGVL